MAPVHAAAVACDTSAPCARSYDSGRKAPFPLGGRSSCERLPIRSQLVSLRMNVGSYEYRITPTRTYSELRIVKRHRSCEVACVSLNCQRSSTGTSGRPAARDPACGKTAVEGAAEDGKAARSVQLPSCRFILLKPKDRLSA
jgi:hypothetical protein